MDSKDLKNEIKNPRIVDTPNEHLSPANPIIRTDYRDIHFNGKDGYEAKFRTDKVSDKVYSIVENFNIM